MPDYEIVLPLRIRGEWISRLTLSGQRRHPAGAETLLATVKLKSIEAAGRYVQTGDEG